MVRGEVFRIRAPKGTRGHEQRGVRYAVVVQADALLGLSTVLVAPTSTGARDAPWRPAVDLEGTRTLILTDQLGGVDAQRLGASAGRLDAGELRSLDDALRLVLGLGPDPGFRVSTGPF